MVFSQIITVFRVSNQRVNEKLSIWQLILNFLLFFPAFQEIFAQNLKQAIKNVGEASYTNSIGDSRVNL